MLSVMNVVCKVTNFQEPNLFFSEKKKNIVMNGTFTKILYSMAYISIMGMYFDFTINGNILNNKYYFNAYENMELILKFANVEKKILHSYQNQHSRRDKRCAYVLHNHLLQGHLKVYTKKEIKNKKYVLKVSGIWENADEIGITYKLLECSYL